MENLFLEMEVEKESDYLTLLDIVDSYPDARGQGACGGPVQLSEAPGARRPGSDGRTWRRRRACPSSSRPRRKPAASRAAGAGRGHCPHG